MSRVHRIVFILIALLALPFAAAISSYEVRFFPTAFTDSSGIASNEANAYDANWATNSTVVFITSGLQNLVYTAVNTSAYRNDSTINWLNVTYTVVVVGTVDDRWRLQRSINGGGSWQNCRAAATGNIAKTNWSCAIALSGWTLLNVSSLVQFRISTDYEGGGSDGARLYLFEVFAHVNFTEPNVAPVENNRYVNETVIIPNMSVTFFSNWTDADDPMGKYVFSTDYSGSWVNYSNLPFGGSVLANYSLQINADPGTNVYWKFYANDSRGEPGEGQLQYFTVASGSDTAPPNITNVTVIPSSAVTGSVFNISALIHDDVGITQANAEITYPNASRQNISMYQASGNRYETLFYPVAGGTYQTRIWAQDGSLNENVSQSVSFNVTANFFVIGDLFGRSDRAYLNGSGFGAGSNVTLDVRLMSDGSSAEGFPVNVTANASGSFWYAWSTPASLTFSAGNYTVYAYDSATPWLNDSDIIRIILKPNATTEVDNGGTSDQLAATNFSDDTRARITCTANEDYHEYTFGQVLPGTYAVTQVIFGIEHDEIRTPGMSIFVYSGGSWVGACNFPRRTVDTFDECDLSAYVLTASDANSLRVRASENDTRDSQAWTDIDFAYLHVTGEPAAFPEGISASILGPITLSAGSTMHVRCNATFNYSAGAGNLTSFAGRLYNEEYPMEAADDATRHYTNSSCSLVGAAGTLANVSCGFGIAYYAVNGTWLCNVTASASGLANGTIGVNTTIDPLFAYAVNESVIDFGALGVGETSQEVSLSFQNLGNQNLSMAAYGWGGLSEILGVNYAFLCPVFNITLDNERFSNISGAGWSVMASLTNASSSMNITIPKQINSSNVTRAAYWQLYVAPKAGEIAPSNISCNGTINFNALPG